MDSQPSHVSSSHTSVTIVGNRKSVGAAFLLAFFFGPLGLLYASVTGGIVMFLLAFPLAFFTMGVGYLFIHIGCIIWAVVAANNQNNSLLQQQSVSVQHGVSSHAQHHQSPNRRIPPKPQRQYQPPPIEQLVPEDEIEEVEIVARPKFCRSCGEKLQIGDARFCGECGSPIT